MLGAGFDIDATREASPIHGNCSYPLIADVLKLCFGLDELPVGKSVEDLFAETLQAGDYKPIQLLVDRVMEADYRIGQKLATSTSSSSYREFFNRFTEAQFLTFNYDSLPEIFLSQQRRWHPEDGYGVAVSTELASGIIPASDARSSSLVIHLHGSACVFTIESEILGDPNAGIAELVLRKEPLFGFDPDSISHCFPRYGRLMSRTGYVSVDERVIAPVPDKSEGLKQAFIRQGYASAARLIEQDGSVIAIGYSFNPFDRGSYAGLLDALKQTTNRKLVIVSPQASEVAKRLSTEYPDLRVHPVEKTFGQWVAGSFRLP